MSSSNSGVMAGAMSRVPWKKTEKKTLSAGLLIALGVAGMFLG
jgi:hypothetical protein